MFNYLYTSILHVIVGNLVVVTHLECVYTEEQDSENKVVKYI